LSKKSAAETGGKYFSRAGLRKKKDIPKETREGFLDDKRRGILDAAMGAC